MVTIERVQSGVRMERRLLKVLKALAEFLDLSLGDLLEGIVLTASASTVTNRTVHVFDYSDGSGVGSTVVLTGAIGDNGSADSIDANALLTHRTTPRSFWPSSKVRSRSASWGSTRRSRARSTGSSPTTAPVRAM